MAESAELCACSARVAAVGALSAETFALNEKSTA